MMHNCFIASFIVMQTAAPQTSAAAAAAAAAASADAQLAIAQGAWCRPTGASSADEAGPVQSPDDALQAGRLQRAAQAYVDAWERAGRPPQAHSEARACRTDKTSPLYLDALVQMGQAHFDAAQQSLREALAHAPRAWCAGLRLRQGLCDLHQHAPEMALDHLQTAQLRDPRRVAIRLASAQAYLALQQPADAIAALKPLLSPVTDAPDAHEIEQARALTSMAIEQDAGHISPLERTAMQNLLAMAQSPDVDAQTVEMALSLADAVPRPRVQTAAALVALKAQQGQAGRRLLKQAFTQATLDPDPARLLALYNVEHGGAVAALPCLQLAAARDPFNSETQSLIAELTERVGALDEAQATLEALRRLEPDQARHQTALARVLAQARKAKPDTGAQDLSAQAQP